MLAWLSIFAAAPFALAPIALSAIDFALGAGRTLEVQVYRGALQPA